jgi:hypothetical protein
VGEPGVYDGKGPKLATREGWSEWKLIKILLDGDGHSNKMNRTTKHVPDSTTQVGQDHIATGMLLVLGTNTQPFKQKLTNMHIRNLHGLLHVLHQSDRWLQQPHNKRSKNPQ